MPPASGRFDAPVVEVIGRMSERVGDLDVAQDLGFQQREWRIQRVAWVVMAIVLAAGLAGLLGSGPLAHASAESDGLGVRYDRIARERAPVELRVTVAPGVARGGEVEIWVTRTLLDKVDIQRIVPQPAAERVDGDRVVFTIAVADPEAATEVSFALEPHDAGGFAGGVGIVDGSQVDLAGFIVP